MIFLSRRHAEFFLILICCSVLFLYLSCGNDTRSSAFIPELERIDSLIVKGATDEALSGLVRTRKHASSAGQWLSLVKRERALQAYEQSFGTLRTALTQLPANETLAAVMCDTLMHLGRFSEAEDYASPLLRSPYSAVAARLGVELLAHNGLDAVPDPAYLTTAYRVSANPEFVKYAAILHAKKGEYVQACDLLLRIESGRFRYLTSLLCHDAGFHEQVHSLYQSENPDYPYVPAELLLAADSCNKLGKIDEARQFWEQVILDHPGYSPVPYFNRAVSGLDIHENLGDVTRCLDEFPLYLPVLALYSHVVREYPVRDTDDPVTQKLSEAGFVSTFMEEDAKILRPTAEAARDFISRALSDPVGKNDPRIHIELIRLAPFLSHAPVERIEAQIWNLLEQFPQSSIAYDFALWYFFSSGSYDTAFSLNQARPDGPDPLYEAFQAAMQGKPETASSYFMRMANDADYAWLGLANAAIVHNRSGDRLQAIEELIIAASMAPDLQTESSIQYRIAVMLESMHSYDRAESVLGYALELDPDNHQARSLLKRIQAGK